MEPLLSESPAGLYCSAGDFYIDPCRKVTRAVITHAHSDHARPGSASYLTTREGRGVLRTRIGPTPEIETLEYGEAVTLNGVRVSLHPAGHILGSAQVRMEHRGEIWVVSGDYKIEPDATCTPFEHVRCHTFITESTFGLPIYRWEPQDVVFSRINAWWRECRDEGLTAVLLAYSLGKAQRLIAGVDSSIGPIYCHAAVEEMNQQYRAAGIHMPATWLPAQAPARKDWGGVLIVAPPSVSNMEWISKFGRLSIGTASGWMQTRSSRRWQGIDRGFVLSDHADWPGLHTAIDESEAEQVLVTHGFTAQMVRWLTEQGRSAQVLHGRTGIAKPDAEDDVESERG